ncbi:hypothetical protein N7376_17265 [Brucella intermedia GD04153]|uniref:Uncharacterized protein n=1 Tax=Brucella intermedia GD04153 TaxID=2975438 RepID=A0AA42H545_9HYPH|nr:hypothetical protein [Brucella intermedia]MDH0125758.1 hypothetical protein [Brucella intermedia GD04153]
MAKVRKKDITNEESNQAWELIEDSPNDRIVAILAGAYLEHYLGRCVRMHLHYVKEITDKDFDFGPFSSFDAKAKLGRLTGIYGDKLYSDLKIIISIRNLFAHRLDIESFSHPEIEQLIGKLKMGDNDVAALKIIAKRNPTLREIFISAVTTITQFIGNRRVTQMPTPPEHS